MSSPASPNLPPGQPLPATPLRDTHGRTVTYLRVSLTDRCNYRCVYCMPAEGDPFLAAPELLRFDEVEQLVRAFAARGVRAVRLTGGEPLVRKDVPELVARLRGVEGIERVTLTTNGHLLRHNASALAAAGLTGLNVSLDSLQADRFAQLTRRGDLARVRDGIEAARAAGIPNLKLNAVVIRGFNDDELHDLTLFAASHGATMRFIEFMPIGQRTLWGHSGLASCVPVAELRAALRARWLMEPGTTRRGDGPARYWTLRGPGLPEEGVDVGFISAVTECFCADCNRLRISARGGLRACLADDREHDLRALLRDASLDEETRQRQLAALVDAALGNKRATHAFDLENPGVTQVPMNAIGG